MFSKMNFYIFRKVIYILLFLYIVVRCVLLCVALCVQSSITVNANEFQKEGNYSKEMLLLFTDVAFPYPHNRIRKWTKDIKVEIVNADKLDKSLVDEVDSIINILSPLIYPLKIYKVPENGNLEVFRKVDSIPISGSVQGFCYMPQKTSIALSWDIKYAKVYDIWYSNFVFHEMLHAIGLQHPPEHYPFYMQISGGYTFKSLEEAEEKFYDRLYISEEEKIIIKMLYSQHIRSGLTKKEFLKQMKLAE